MNANGQEPDKVGKVLDDISQFGDSELLDGLSDATGIHWEGETANRIFGYKKEKPYSTPKIAELNLGKYSGHPDIIKLTGTNHTNGGVEYLLDISSKRYLQQNANLFDNIRNYNKDLKNSKIEFTINGAPLPNKTINI